MVYYALKMLKPDAFCDGAPYIYATFHHEASNILKYSRNGCLLDVEVLVGGPNHALSSHLVELRSIVFGSFAGKRVLYVADAYSEDSYLNVYGGCDASGKRSYIGTPVSTLTNPGINHLYGIAFDPEGNLFVSNQHTDNVLRFERETFEPMALPSAMVQSSVDPLPSYYPGTFIQFGAPRVHDVTEQGVRDVAAVGDKIWVANEDDDSVRVLDAFTGLVEDIIHVQLPIGLLYSPADGVVFISSKGEKGQGLVYALSVTTKEVVGRYKSKKMTHPTGMAVHHATLYVANQKLGQIVSFDILSGKFLRIIVDFMPMGIEKILISDC